MVSIIEGARTAGRAYFAPPLGASLVSRGALFYRRKTARGHRDLSEPEEGVEQWEWCPSPAGAQRPRSP
jgi:hypothetical protein